MIRVLVCGGREYNDATAVYSVLDTLSPQIETIVCGGAAGADTLALQWVEQREMRCEVYLADWRKYGKAAGAIRNKQMLEQGKPDLVIAFPGGKGTANMIRQAKKAGVRVQEITDKIK